MGNLETEAKMVWDTIDASDAPHLTFYIFD